MSKITRQHAAAAPAVAARAVRGARRRRPARKFNTPLQVASAAVFGVALVAANALIDRAAAPPAAQPAAVATAPLPVQAAEPPPEEAVRATVQLRSAAALPEPGKVLPAGVDGAPPVDLEALAATAPEAATVPVRSPEEQRARAALVRERLGDEVPDLQWADQLTRQFGQLTGFIPGFDAIDVAGTDCRETLCAVDLAFNSSAHGAQLGPQMARLDQFMGMQAWVHHDPDANRAVLYLARHARSLPDLAP